MPISDNTAALIKALEAGNYNAKPTKLCQGCVTAFFWNEDGTLREGTEEEWDRLYENVEKERNAAR